MSSSAHSTVASALCALSVVLTLSLTASAWAQAADTSSQAPADSQAKPQEEQQGPPPAMVRVAPVQKQSLQQHWDVVGRLRETRRVIVSAEGTGKLVEVPVEEGDPVQAGKTVLARIEDVWVQLERQAARADLDQAQAEVAASTAELDQTQRDLKYLQDLATAGSAKPKEVEDARSKAAANRARLNAASARVAAAQTRIQRTHEQLQKLAVLAPFDGVIVRKIAEAGQWMTPGSEVVEIVSRGHIDAFIDVPEQLINHVAIGQPMELIVEPLKMEVTGKVVAVIPVGDNPARTFPVKIRMDDRDGKLKTGMSVVAHVPTGQQAELLTVPRDAIHRMPAGTVVWITANQIALPVRVQVLFGVGDRYAVNVVDTSGPPLADQMPVVIEGGERLFPGRPVMIPPATAPASADADAGHQ